MRCVVEVVDELDDPLHLPPLLLAVARDVQRQRGRAQRVNAVQRIPCDELPVPVALLLTAEACAVQDAHLLEDGGLAALAGAEEEALDEAAALLGLHLQPLVDGRGVGHGGGVGAREGGWRRGGGHIAHDRGDARGGAAHEGGGKGGCVDVGWGGSRGSV